MTSQRIGFIGTGVMGRSMAGHLMKAGHRLSVFTRTRSKAEPLLEGGASWKESPRELASDSDVVISVVSMPSDVEAIYSGQDGVLAAARPNTLLIDMTTSSPKLAQRLATQARERDLWLLDAPVSGGDIGARNAQLSIMVGGDKAAFERALPLFELMGKRIVYQGGPGAGQSTKMSNQIAVASTMIAVCEAVAYARVAGLDPSKVLESISSGAAASWSLSELMPRALRGDYAPGFMVAHFVKDLKIAVDSAREMKLELPGLELAQRLYESLAADGKSDRGTHVLLQRYLEHVPT